MLELDDESKIIKKLLVNKEICSCLPTGLDGRKVCSQHNKRILQHRKICQVGLNICKF